MNLVKKHFNWATCKSAYILTFIAAACLILMSCSDSSVSEPAAGTQIETVVESASTPIPTEVPTKMPTAAPAPTPILEIQINDCDDIPDLDQRAMCQLGLEMGLDMEEMMEMAESMDVEEMMDIAESMDAEELMDIAESMDVEELMDIAESMDAEELMDIAESMDVEEMMEDMMESMDFDMDDMMENMEQMNCESIRDEFQRMACEMSQQIGLDTDQSEVDGCDAETDMMKRMMCKMTESTDMEEMIESMDMSEGSGQQDAQPTIDPANPPKVATHNFIDLEPFIRITKIRAVYGHNYNYGSPEYDPTGASCSSMKHYFDAYTTDQRWGGNFGSYDTSGIVKFYSPVDGDLYSIITNEIEQGTEYQFYLSPTGYQNLMFTFHHVDLLEEFINGGSVTAGQHIGYIIRPNGQGEIATMISGGGITEYISFFDVMSDEVFAEYQARGITSRAQMTISKEERAANPIPCNMGDDMGGKFYSASGDEAAFNLWQDGPDNWVELTN